MATTLMNLLPNLSVGEPIAWQRLRLLPLTLQGMANLEYLTLVDSVSETRITIEETSPAGSVPELKVHNRASSRVLIPEGSTLIGAKQNRVVNLSVMIAPESVTLIPVSCLECGRWRVMTPQVVAGCIADWPLRAMMCRDATASLKKAGKVHVDQGEVWRHVDSMLQGAGAYSPTSAYHALDEKWQSELADYEARLHLPENASGVAVEIGGLLQAVDLFDKPSTLHKLWPRLVKSYSLAALGPRVAPGTRTDVRAFLDRVLSSEGELYEPVGVGTTIRLTNADAVGSALMCEDQLVHLSLFANGEPKPRCSEPPRPAAQAREPGDQPKRSSRRNPWWQFWAWPSA
jgi:hypothetical protein